MDYIIDAFKRMSLNQIRNFLLHGTQDFEKNTQSYRDALKNGTDPIYKRLDEVYPNIHERDKAAADLSHALTAYENVYLELGMKARARLLWQLLLSDDQPVKKGGKLS